MYKCKPFSPTLRCNIIFTLIVNDFGINKYTPIANFHHLRAAVEELYIFAIDMTGGLYCGLTLDWDYTSRHADVSVPGYITQVLQNFTTPLLPSVQQSPTYIRPNYGAPQQFSFTDDETPLLPPAGKTRIWQLAGTLLSYSRSVNSTILPTLGTLSTM